MKIPDIPYVMKTWQQEHPGEPILDGHVFTQPWPAGPNGGRHDQVIYYQYRHDRARRTLRGTGEQVAKAHNAIAGKAPIKRNRFHPAQRWHPHRQPGARSDLQARPVYPANATPSRHMTIMFAALAVSRWIEHQTGWSMGNS